MPRITRLEPDRRSGRVFLEVDGAPWGSLPDVVAVSRALTPGDELTAGLLDEIRADAEREDALAAAFHCLAYRPRSTLELSRHLRRKGHDEPAVTAAIDRCEELGYLDDDAFARAFVRDRIRLRPVGRTRLRAELRARGIYDRDADGAIDGAFEETGVTESDLLRAAARRRARSLQSTERPKARSRLAGFLLRRGFPGGSVRAVVDELLPDATSS